MEICWCWTALQASRELQLQVAILLLRENSSEDSTAQPQNCLLSLLYTARIYELAEIHFVFPYIRLGI